MGWKKYKIIADSSKYIFQMHFMGRRYCSLAEGSSYLLKKFHVHDYGSKKFISKDREDLPIYDIGVIASSNEHPQPTEIHCANCWSSPIRYIQIMPQM